MIYGFQLEQFLAKGLTYKLKNNSFKNVNKMRTLIKLVKIGDIVINANYTDYVRKEMVKLIDKGIIVFPRKEIRNLVSNRQAMLKRLSSITKFKLKREYKESGELIVPDFNNLKVVAKFGNEHQGKDKALLNSLSEINARKPVTFEEFVPNAKSFRIFTIDDNRENWFVIDYIEPKYPCEKYLENSWLKNIECEFKTYSYKDRYKINILNIDDIIEDVSNMKNNLNHDYLGFDYVQNSNRTAFLEVNDIPGAPLDNKELTDKIIDYFYNLTKEFQ